MKNTSRFFWVDAFTAQPFHGNPAVVCIGETPLPVSLMQKIAFEFGVSETAFITPAVDGFSLRWFTPCTEVPLCGHATLASSAVLFREKYVSEDSEILFHTASGVLRACRNQKGIELNFPVVPVYQAEVPGNVTKALNIKEPVFTGKAGEDWFIELTSENEVRNASVDFIQLQSVWKKGVIITASGSGRADFVSRYFAPGEGINEDPVTGSAHCALGYYWHRKLQKSSFLAHQLSRRGGEIILRIQEQRVFLTGQAFIICSGTLGEPDTWISLEK